jgi:excisionase family DNA binding protein
MENKYYTIKETAEILKVSRQQLYQLVKKNNFPHTKIGSKIIVPSKLLDEYLKKNTVSYI